MMKIYKLSTCDDVHRYKKSVIIEFKGKRKVLSTSPFNGGYEENLKYVFNHDSNPGAGIACTMKAPTYEEHMRIIAQEIGLDPNICAGISTAAHMENLAIYSQTYDDFTVTALVTGGIEVNGGRVGDVASYHEKQGKATNIKEGTINIMLVIDADLPAATMARALVTCTEAKTAAIQELMLGSNYSRGIATGSGTDGTIVISNSESNVKLTNAGKHSKLGEYIGRVVKKAVKEALYLQTGACPEEQYSFLRRMRRFGVNEDILWENYKNIYKSHLDSEGKKMLTTPEFMHNLHMLDKESEFVTLSSLYAHLIDQFDWDLLKKEDVINECNYILNRLSKRDSENTTSHGAIKDNLTDKEEIINLIIKKYISRISFIVGSEEYV